MDNGTHWTWEAPDLSEGSPFHKARMKRLREVIAICRGPPSWLEEGKWLLTEHRKNYGPEGPKSLVVLWWEWPQEHWEALQEGSSMNFVLEPASGIVENTKMTPE